MTPEGRVKAQVKKVLARFADRIYWHMPVQNGMGEPTLDFVGCLAGLFFAIETKAPGGKPTKRQLLTMAAMRAAGAHVFVVSNDDELYRLQAYLELFAA